MISMQNVMKLTDGKVVVSEWMATLVQCLEAIVKGPTITVKRWIHAPTSYQQMNGQLVTDML